jgi:hypothetical protein
VVGHRHFLSCPQRNAIAFHNAGDIWAVELSIEFEIVPAPVQTVYYFWVNLLLKDEQLVLFPFCQHPRFTAVQQDRADQGRVDVPGVTRDPKYTNLLTILKFLSPKATVCLASRIVLFLAPIMYFVR